MEVCQVRLSAQDLRDTQQLSSVAIRTEWGMRPAVRVERVLADAFTLRTASSSPLPAAVSKLLPCELQLPMPGQAQHRRHTHGQGQASLGTNLEPLHQIEAAPSHSQMKEYSAGWRHAHNLASSHD